MFRKNYGLNAVKRHLFVMKLFIGGVNYVAVGLSRDERMGEDSVMECVVEQGAIRAFTSYNNPRSNTREGVVRCAFLY